MISAQIYACSPACTTSNRSAADRTLGGRRQSHRSSARAETKTTLPGSHGSVDAEPRGTDEEEEDDADNDDDDEEEDVDAEEIGARCGTVDRLPVWQGASGAGRREQRRRRRCANWCANRCHCTSSGCAGGSGARASAPVAKGFYGRINDKGGICLRIHSRNPYIRASAPAALRACRARPAAL